LDSSVLSKMAHWGSSNNWPAAYSMILLSSFIVAQNYRGERETKLDSGHWPMNLILHLESSLLFGSLLLIAFIMVSLLFDPYF
jgi:hypothetical protein